MNDCEAELVAHIHDKHGYPLNEWLFGWSELHESCHINNTDILIWDEGLSTWPRIVPMPGDHRFL